MSLAQIKREFPFVKHLLPEYERHYLMKDRTILHDAVVEMRVSRLSLDALQLSMEGSTDEDGSLVEKEIEIRGITGASVDCRRYAPTAPIEGKSLGDILTWIFTPEDREWTKEVAYIVYITSHWVVRGENRYVNHRQVVLFKMPKRKTLWQLIRRYRRIHGIRV